MFKLSLRELFLLLTLAAILVAWWLDRRNSAAELAKAEASRIDAEDKWDHVFDRYMTLYGSVAERGIGIIETASGPTLEP